MEINNQLNGFYTTTSLYTSCEVKIMTLLSDFIGQDKKKKKCIGLLLMFAAGAFLVLGNSLFQYVEMESPAHARISADQMLIIRCAIQLLFSIVFMVHGKIHVYGRWKKNLLPLIAMGVMEVCVILFMYEAIQRMPVGDATVLQFTAPVFTTFLSFVFLKTKLRLFDAIFGILSFTGVIFIAKPNLLFPAKISVVKVLHTPIYHHNSTYRPVTAKQVVYNLHYLEGAMFAIGAALSLSLFFILNKINGMKIDVILTIFYPSFIGVLVGPIIMLIRSEKFLITEVKGEYWGIIVTIGFLSFIGLMLLGEALQLQDPGPAIMIRNCDIVIVYILQYLLMHILPTMSAAIGTILIIGCSSIIILNHTFNLDQKCCGDQCYREEDDEEDETKFMLLDDKNEDIEDKKEFEDENELDSNLR